MIYQHKFKILSNRKITKDFFELEIASPEISKNAKAGQFVHVHIQDGNLPFLRRPFAIHNVIEKKNFQILYKVRGLGTKILSSKRKNQLIDIMGPLGNGFDLDSIADKIMVVAGGIGIAPLVFLLKKLSAAGKKIITFIGADSKENLLCQNEIKKLKSDIVVATEDGSEGKKAKITKVLNSYLLNNDVVGYQIFAAGPKGMLKVVSKLSQKYSIPAQLSLDAIIACGIGACLGCAILTNQGYKLVCKDGPVFKAGDIVWQ